MNKTPKQIEIELEETNKRFAELFQMRANLETNIDTLQDGLTQGAANSSLDRLQTAQDRLTLINKSISALKQTQVELEKAFDKAVNAEKRNQQIEKSKAIALEAAHAHDDYQKFRFKLDESISIFGEKMVDALFQFVKKQVELENSLTGDIESIIMREELGLPKDTINIISAPTPRKSLIEFAEPVTAIEMFIRNQRGWAAKQKKEKAEAQVFIDYWKAMDG